MITDIDKIRYCHVIALRIHFMISMISLEITGAANENVCGECGQAYHALFKKFIARAKPIFETIEVMNNRRAVAFIDTPFEENVLFLDYKEKIKKAIIPVCDQLANSTDAINAKLFSKLKVHLVDM